MDTGVLWCFWGTPVVIYYAFYYRGLFAGVYIPRPVSETATTLHPTGIGKVSVLISGLRDRFVDFLISPTPPHTNEKKKTPRSKKLRVSVNISYYN